MSEVRLGSYILYDTESFNEVLQFLSECQQYALEIGATDLQLHTEVKSLADDEHHTDVLITVIGRTERQIV